MVRDPKPVCNCQEDPLTLRLGQLSTKEFKSPDRPMLVLATAGGNIEATLGSEDVNFSPADRLTGNEEKESTQRRRLWLPQGELQGRLRIAQYMKP